MTNLHQYFENQTKFTLSIPEVSTKIGHNPQRITNSSFSRENGSTGPSMSASKV